jgi:pathogenesis-related protein 1
VKPRTSMIHEIIDAHNIVRSRVGTAPLTWSDRLAGVAQEWANHLMANGQFAHSHNPNYGENLYEISGAAATPNQVIKAFADEVSDYDYRSNSCRGVCGHYTQVVWNNTKEVGCAVARDGRREVWVCEYYPPGNWVGRKPY